MHAEFWLAGWVAGWRLTVDGPRHSARCTTASSSDGCMKKTQRSTVRKIILNRTTLSFLAAESSVQSDNAFPTNHVRCAEQYSTTRSSTVSHRGQRPIFTMTANSGSLQKFDNSCTARIFSLHDFQTILNAKAYGSIQRVSGSILTIKIDLPPDPGPVS